MMNYILFPILDSTGWYLKCDTLVCPRQKQWTWCWSRTRREDEWG